MRPRSWLAQPGSLHFLAMCAAVANLVLLAALLLKAKELMMKHHVIVAAGAAACLLLSGCASGKLLEDYAEAANALDPDCGKKVHAELKTQSIFGFPVPTVSGTFDKVCKPEMLLDAATQAAIRASVSEALAERR